MSSIMQNLANILFKKTPTANNILPNLCFEGYRTPETFMIHLLLEVLKSLIDVMSNDRILSNSL